MFRKVEGGSSSIPQSADVSQSDLQGIANQSINNPELSGIQSLPGTDEDEIARRLHLQKVEQDFAAQAQRSLLEFKLVHGTHKAGNINEILGKGSVGANVKNLQKQLNEWRVANGEPPIKEDGIFGDATEKAVKNFQKASGLESDGLAGPNTKTRLELECSNDFKGLKPDIQDKIRTLLNRHQHDYFDANTHSIHSGPASRENIAKLVKDPNFHAASHGTQKAALDTIAKDPSDPINSMRVLETTKEINQFEQGREFHKLPETTKNHVRSSLFEHAGDHDFKNSLKELTNSESFNRLTAHQQQKVLDTTTNLPGMQQIIETKGFSQMDQIEKERVLNVAIRHADNPQRLQELHQLLNSPEFVNASKHDQNIQLKQFEESDHV